jgi:hypothetical protein
MTRVILSTVVAFSLTSGCRETSAPLTSQPSPAIVEPPVAAVRNLDPPADGQVLRDTMPEIVRLARLGRYPINPKKFVITKEADPYEKDECNATVHVNKTWFKVTAVYRRAGDFWKLRGLSN